MPRRLLYVFLSSSAGGVVYLLIWGSLVLLYRSTTQDPLPLEVLLSGLLVVPLFAPLLLLLFVYSWCYPCCESCRKDDDDEEVGEIGSESSDEFSGHDPILP